MLRKVATSLNTSNITALQQVLPSWEFVEATSQVTKTFNFESKKQAWDFCELVSKVITQNNSHPAWLFHQSKVVVFFPPFENTDLEPKHIWVASFMDKAEHCVKQEETN